MGMSAVEILEWLQSISITTRKKVFGYKILDDIFSVYTSQGIVNRIERYEAEKNHITDADKKVDVTDTNVGSIEQEFNVGDWVYHRKFGLGKITDVYTNSVTAYSVRYGGNRAWDKERLEHAEPPKEEKDCEDCKHYAKDQYSVPCCFCVSHHEKFEPKEEKQKIEKLEVYYDGFSETQMKINELVNAVNELRGV